MKYLYSIHIKLINIHLSTLYVIYVYLFTLAGARFFSVPTFHITVLKLIQSLISTSFSQRLEMANLQNPAASIFYLQPPFTNKNCHPRKCKMSYLQRFILILCCEETWRLTVTASCWRAGWRPGTRTSSGDSTWSG